MRSGLLAWVVTIGMVALIMWIQAAGGAGSVASDPEAPMSASEKPESIEPGAMFGVMGKYAVFAAGVSEATGPTPGAVQQVLSPLEAMATRPIDRVRIAIVAGEVVGAEAALERLDVIETDEQDDAVAEDVAALRSIYGEGELDGAARDRLVERHGWFGRLALVHGGEADDEARREVLGAAMRVGGIVVGAFFGALALGVVGFGLFVTAIVLLATGGLRPRFAPPIPGGSAGLETFAVFLVAFMVVQIVASGLVELLGEAAAPVTPVLIWSLLLVPLWPLLRGGTLAGVRQSLGWHRGRGLAREVGSGLLGYLAGLPVVGLGIGATILLMTVASMILGEEPAPPAHPLPEELAAGGPLVAVQLILMATVWAPLVEESIFRGALYSHLRGRVPAVVAGLVTALLFAAIHPQGVLAIPALMSLGFVFAMLREWRGSIIAPVVAHALNNGMLVAMLLILFAG